MKVIGKDRTSCDVCNPIDEILARLDALERRASAIVAKVQGLAPDGEGNVTLPTSSSDTDPLHGRIDAFAMSSEVKEAADDAHAYAASIADDVIVINSEIDALNQAVAALQPAEIEAIKLAVETLQTTVATLESTVATLNNSVAGKVSKSGDTMTGMLHLTGGCSLSTTPDKAVTDVPIFSTMREIDVSTVNSYQVAASINMHWSGWKYSGGMTNWRDATFTAMNVIADSSAGSQTKLTVWQPNDRNQGWVSYPSWSVGTNDNSDKILTIKMANGLPSLVHTTGNETISGTKKFSVELIRYHGSAGAGSIPTGDQYIPIVNCQGNDDKDFGWIRIFAQKDTKQRIMQFQINKVNDDGTVSENAYIQLIADDGVNPARATAPTTPSGATGEEIATAGWVRNLINQFATANNLNGI